MVVLIVWTTGLAIDMLSQSPPARHVVTWVGLDIGLIFAFVVAGWLALRRDPRLGLVAAASGTAVLLDAWFDVTTAGPSWLSDSILLAATVEMPFVLVSAAVAAWAYTRRYRSSNTFDESTTSGLGVADASSAEVAVASSGRG
ncbi:hypothetical protein [Fodinicola feengrottensis]|uniref:hypothetical protein n=1 Tax=Fodinicola feengrottensis TaxID=435914 RepID=UPI0024424AB7|nr:hypothetical protein [Fodinicola feengrottensis]